MQVKYKSVFNFSVVVIADEPISFPDNVLQRVLPDAMPGSATIPAYNSSKSIEVFDVLGTGPAVQPDEVVHEVHLVAPEAPQKKARKPKAEKPAAAEPAQQPEKNPNFKQFTGDDVRNALRAALAAGVDSDDVNELLIKRGYDNISAIGENQKVFAHIIEEANRLIARNS